MINEYVKFHTYRSCLVLDIMVHELDLKSTPNISKHVEPKISEMNYPSLIINLDNIAYIDSIGISLLIRLGKQIRTNGNKISIFCDDDSIQQVLEAVNIKSLVKVFDNINESVRYTKSEPGLNVID